MLLCVVTCQASGYTHPIRGRPGSEATCHVAKMFTTNPGHGRGAPLIYIPPDYRSNPYPPSFPSSTMNSATKVCLGCSNSFIPLINYDFQPHCATVYDIPERPRVPVLVPKIPILRYQEICPTPDDVSEIDEEDCLTGYGEVTVSEHRGVVDASEKEQRHRVPRPRRSRPSSQCQTTRVGLDHVSPQDSGFRGEPVFTDSDAEQFEPEYFRHIIKTNSPTDRPVTPSVDFRTFFENLRNTPQLRKQRTLPQNSPASEAIDARPRSN